MSANRLPRHRLIFLAACGDGLLLGYDAIHHRSLLVPLVTYGALTAVGMAFGGLFGWANQKSPQWQEWHNARKTLTPGWRDGDRR